MVLALEFIAVMVASLVMVSRSSTITKRFVRKCNDDEANRPSQRILDLAWAMAPIESFSQFSELSEIPVSSLSATHELMPEILSAPMGANA